MLTKSTEIEFINPDTHRYDATQFDTHDEKELAELWWEFCKENNFFTVTKGNADYETGVMIMD